MTSEEQGFEEYTPMEDAIRKYKKGDLSVIQADLRDSGELVTRSATQTNAELRIGQYLVGEGFRLVSGWFVGKYEFDFKISGAAVLLEVDGAVHRTQEKQERDAIKDRVAMAAGYRVVRVLNHEPHWRIAHSLKKVLANEKKVPREVWVVREGWREWFARWRNWLFGE